MNSTVFGLLKCRVFEVGLLLISFAGITTAQVVDRGVAARQLLEWPEEQQIAFVTSVLDTGFPVGSGDEFALLVVNKSRVVVPRIEARIEIELRKPGRSDRLIDLAAAMIVYAGDEESLHAAAKLISLDETRFGELVGRALDNAVGRRNPFSVVYAGLRIGDESVSKRVVEWSAHELSSDRMRRLWGEALVEKYGRVPSQNEWDSDPLASGLKMPQASRLRHDVLRFSAEAAAKR